MVQKLWLRNTERSMLFDSCDLDFDLMTLVLGLDPDIMVTYWYTKMRSIGHSERHSDRHIDKRIKPLPTQKPRL